MGRPRLHTKPAVASGPATGARVGAAAARIRSGCYLPAKRSLAVDNPEPNILATQHTADEWFWVTARRCEQRHDVASMGVFQVVARTAVVPEQPPLRAGHRCRGFDELGGIGAQQNIRRGGHPGQGAAERLRVAAVILDDQISVTVERPPDLQGPRRLSAETRVAAR